MYYNWSYRAIRFDTTKKRGNWIKSDSMRVGKVLKKIYEPIKNINQ